MWKKIYSTVFAPRLDDEEINQRLSGIKASMPTPVFWLLGKTQSGKTSIIRALTGDSRAQIGNGMQPCTRTAFVYDFPDSQDCFMRFLDTRGLGEIDYEPAADLETFREQAHVLIVVMKAMDHAQHEVMSAVRAIHQVKPDWPVIVVQTALHEGYPDPGFEHLSPYPYDQDEGINQAPDQLRRSLLEQRALFEGIDAQFVPVDLTLPEDGYQPVSYGLDAFWRSLETALPHGIAMMLHEMKDIRKELHDAYSAASHPHIIAYSLISGAAGVVPVPFVDVPVVTVVQAKMFQTIASLYHYKLDRKSWAEISSALGMTLLTNLGRRELIKMVPVYGLAVSSLLTAATTYALGKTLTVYFQNLRSGKELSHELFRIVYREQFEQGRNLLKNYMDEIQHQVLK
ncbi:MAG: GTPase family protein [Gammaproteobacteria bacterium]